MKYILEIGLSIEGTDREILWLGIKQKKEQVGLS